MASAAHRAENFFNFWLRLRADWMMMKLARACAGQTKRILLVSRGSIGDAFWMMMKMARACGEQI